MKRLLLVAAFATACVGAPLEDDPKNARITDYRNEPDGNGGYHFEYRTSDGTYREETGVLKNPGSENEAMEVVGRTTWLSEGKEYSVAFIANENGYVIRAEPLPKTAERFPEATERRPTGLGVQPPRRRTRRSAAISIQER